MELFVVAFSKKFLVPDLELLLLIPLVLAHIERLPSVVVPCLATPTLTEELLLATILILSLLVYFVLVLHSELVVILIHLIEVCLSDIELSPILRGLSVPSIGMVLALSIFIRILVLKN